MSQKWASIYRSMCVWIIAASWPSFACADVVTDLWDVNQGSVVTDFFVAGTYPGSDIRDMFGGQFGTIYPGTTIFPDAGWLPGIPIWVNWETPSTIDLNRFVLNVAADGNWPETYNRAIRGFQLFSSDDGTQWNSIYDSGTLTAPLGSYSNGLYYYTIDHTFNTPVSSKHFRALFIADTITGPRIIELDGYGAVPEPTSLALLASGGFMACTFLRRKRLSAASLSESHEPL